MQATSDFQEFIFLSGCYESGISEQKIYSLFIEKVISDYSFHSFPTQLKISYLHKHLISVYGIEIPPTFIEQLIKEMVDFNSCFTLEKDAIVFKEEPKRIKNQYQKQQKDIDDESILILAKFNEYLKNNHVKPISYAEFKDALSVYFSHVTNINKVDNNENTKLLIEWIKNIYRSPNQKEICIVFDKIMYSWLLYAYFYSVRRSKKKLENTKIILDTNLIVYLLGVNGPERKFFVEYLFGKLKDNNCSIIINSFTVDELLSLLNKSNTIDIANFRVQNPEIITQLNANYETFLKNLIETKFFIPVFFDNKKISLNSEEAKDYISSLKKFKHDEASYESIEHDIKLLYSVGEIKKVNDIYSEKKLIASSDYFLDYWLRSYKKRTYNSEVSLFLPLDKMNLIFWIESDKCVNSKFLMNTWISVSDSIDYFKNQSVNTLLSVIEDKYIQGNLPPENWRSVYLLLQDTIKIDETKKNLSKQEILDAINRIANVDSQENFELIMEMNKLQETVKDLQNRSPIVIQNVLPEKKADDFSFFELLLALLKKILSLIFKLKK